MATTDIQCLFADILGHVIGHYCRDYRFLCQFVCKRWSNIITNEDKKKVVCVDNDDSDRLLPLSAWHAAVNSVVRYHRPCNDNDAFITRPTATLMSIAARGHINIFRWFADMGVLNGKPKLIMRFEEAAAEAGHVPLMQFCMTTWNILPDDNVMIAAARGGHDDIVITCRDVGNISNLRWVIYQVAKYGREAIVRLYKETWNPTVETHVIAHIADSAAEGGHDSIVRLCYDWGVTGSLWTSAIISAARGGHLHTVQLCLQLCSNALLHTYQAAMCTAAKCGHIDIVSYLREHAIAALQHNVDMNDVMTAAATSGHENIVRMCYDVWNVRKTETLTSVAYAAAQHGQSSIVKLVCCVWNISVDMDIIAQAAAQGGFKSIVRLCLSKGAKDLHRIVRIALTCGYFYIAWMCKEAWGFNDPEYVLCVAAESGHDDIFHLGCEWGARDFDFAMETAAAHGNTDIMNLCYENGARNVCECYEIAKGTHNFEAMYLCELWMSEDDEEEDDDNV